MSIRDRLKQREEKRSSIGAPSDLPEGVKRYVQLGQELKDGKVFILLENPDDWFFYYVHEDAQYQPRETYVQKHTCLHSPKTKGADFDAFEKPGKNECLSCKAGIKRKLYFMPRVFDPEYGVYRVLDLKEFHANNLIDAYDKLEKAAKKFNKGYTLVGDAVVIKKSNDGKSYTLEAADTDGLEAQIEAAKAFIGQSPDYTDLMFLRDDEGLLKIIEAAADGHADKAAVGIGAGSANTPAGDKQSTPIDDEPPFDKEPEGDDPF